MTQDKQQSLPKIGYLFHFPKLDHPTDKFRLDIYISSEPTNQHFDVLHAFFPIKTQKKSIRQLKVTQPWHFETDYRVCAGLVVMEDRKGSKEEAFSFGGRLAVENQEWQTVCSLVSPAPIFEINEATPLHILFIEEVEILLAENQVKFQHHEDYEQQLSQAEPMELYLACLAALTVKFEALHHRTDLQTQLLIYLHAQKHRLEAAGIARDPAPRLAEIFN